MGTWKKRRWQPWQVIGLGALVLVSVVGLALAGFVTWGMRDFGEGEPTGAQEKAQAQAMLDRGSPDFPIELTDMRIHTFMGDTWQEWHLRARETGATYTVKPHAGEDPTGEARLHFKIARDGELGRPAMQQKLPADLTAEVDDVVVWAAGDPPPVDFTTRAPYDHRLQPLEIEVELAGRRMTNPAYDAAMARKVVDWARTEQVTLDNVRLSHEDEQDVNLRADTFVLRGEALTAPDLAGRLTVAKAAYVPGQPEVTVDEVTYRQVGSLPGPGDPTPSRGPAAVSAAPSVHGTGVG